MNKLQWMKARPRDVLAAGLALVLAGCLAGVYLTRDSPLNPGAVPQGDDSESLVDQRLLSTARRLFPLADTGPERLLAAEAMRLSDHEVDQAFASALREAAGSASAAAKNLSPGSDRVSKLRARVADDQKTVAQLGKEGGDSAAVRLQLAKAELALHEDELEDAVEDLAREGVDQHARLERELQEHEAGAKIAPQAAKNAVAPATLAEAVNVWAALQGRRRQLTAAWDQVFRYQFRLAADHKKLEGQTGSVPLPASGEEASLERLHQLAEQSRSLAELDKRFQDSRQLAGVYRRWDALAGTRQRAVLRLILIGAAQILAILLCALLLERAIRRFLLQRADRRRARQLRLIAAIAVQFAACLCILFVIFGLPAQTPTIIGLATAGLTVVLKDFIVAFCGWFVLMGRNGVHVGDWVEIDGVGGEVIEIGLLRTVLLEMGDWTGTGHPTGRRVTFMNGYAIEGHYFNFSTEGQWLWDVLQISLPPSADPYETMERIREAVARETAEEALLAELDWERVTRQYGMRPFAATPNAELRPSAGGVDVIVRYITRAPQRHEVKSRLFQRIVELLRHPAAGAATVA